MPVAAVSREPESVFRTIAWVQAWIDTWGKDKRLTLIDLGGSSNPLEHVYITKQSLKKIIPVKTLCLAGIACGQVSTPRAEYNDINNLVHAAGGVKEFRCIINKLDWQRFHMPDILAESEAGQLWSDFIEANADQLAIKKIDRAYAIEAGNVDDYLRSLGGNTRLAYFNRRKNLIKEGSLDFREFRLEESEKFFEILNNFHSVRWGRPCYSSSSQMFLINFAERLQNQNGKIIMQGMRVNGEIVSVLFDVVWRGVRYNFQSGYFENRYPKIALGAVHMGYGIEQAIANREVYDCLAGEGKNSNYKFRIANKERLLESFCVERGVLHSLRKIKIFR